MVTKAGKGVSRRSLVLGSAGMMLAAARNAASMSDTGEGVSLAAGPRPLVAYTGKRPLIRVHTRPPHLETPFSVFDDSLITPNDAFFVRYHLANLPLSVDLNTFRLSVSGNVARPLSLSMDALRALSTPESVVAVNQCSGNSRGYSNPRVFGAQLGHGAMGNAKWTGMPLHKLLNHAGIRSGSKLVVFNGFDKPVLPSTPDFLKSLDIDHALSEGPLLAWGMNDADLPYLNGYPLKLIVPGYFGTYWVKHLSEIRVLDGDFSGQDAYFMETAYRLPDNDCHCVEPGAEMGKSVPIAHLPVRSFLTNLANGSDVKAGTAVPLRGIAFDGGSGIRRVEVSVSGGPWIEARLGEDMGRYSFRGWQASLTMPQNGTADIRVRATSNNGETQPMEASWNHGGYRRNVVEQTSVRLV